MELLVFIGLLGIGYFSGTYFEKSHFRSLRKREIKAREFEVHSLEKVPQSLQMTDVKLVCGNVVISSDYFKTFAANIRSIFGGRISVYESLLDRARREATLRMIEEARAWGAKAIYNSRLETSSLNGEAAKKIVTVEVLAYGTAIK